MGEKMTPCAECGMPCEPGEYHPYAACLMFKGCYNSTAVRANLTQPAQAVDVGAIREVIDMLNGYCEASDDCCYGTLSTSLVRDLTARITRALGNAQAEHPKYVPPKPCQCLTVQQRALCADRDKCGVITTQTTPPQPEE